MIDIVFDVDGVWNAFPPEEHAVALGRPWPPAWGWECDPTEVRIERFRITYATALAERLGVTEDEVAEAGDPG